jgi:hypothetical protein
VRLPEVIPQPEPVRQPSPEPEVEYEDAAAVQPDFEPEETYADVDGPPDVPKQDYGEELYQDMNDVMDKPDTADAADSMTAIALYDYEACT